jgi:hypothetical protein
MVLVSFYKQFIYTGTNKTGSTSVEVFFEPDCLPPDGYEQVHFRGETITDYGIVGFRGPNMPAVEVRKYLGGEFGANTSNFVWLESLMTNSHRCIYFK